MKYNSHTVRIAYGFVINFVENPISESAAWFFVIILN